MTFAPGDDLFYCFCHPWGVKEGGLGNGSEAPSPALAYASRVGQRLRAIRKQKRLSLQEVEAISGHEFKASVLGAYERGERVISVPRLQRLAALYNVPVDQLLPPAAEAKEALAAPAEPSRMSAARSSPGGQIPEKVTFDLTRFRGVDGDPQVEMVKKYLASIQVLRQDFNGRMLTVRRDDIRAMAGLFGTDAGALVRRLDDLRLRIEA